MSRNSYSSYFLAKHEVKRLNQCFIVAVVYQIYFIYHFFIPFLNGLQFLTNKELDYKDWKLGVEVLVRELHKTELGKIYLLELMSRINSARLTPNNYKFRAISL